MSARRTPERTPQRTGKTRMDRASARPHGVYYTDARERADALARPGHARVTHTYTNKPVRPCVARAGAGFARALPRALWCAVTVRVTVAACWVIVCIVATVDIVATGAGSVMTTVPVSGALWVLVVWLNTSTGGGRTRWVGVTAGTDVVSGAVGDTVSF